MVEEVKFVRGGEKMKAFGIWYLAVGSRLMLAITVVGILLCGSSFGQTDRGLAREGNKLYNNKKYTDAEVKYKKALSKNNKLTESKFNLGDAYYKQEKYDDAAQQYQEVIAQSSDKTLQS